MSDADADHSANDEPDREQSQAEIDNLLASVRPDVDIEKAKLPANYNAARMRFKRAPV